MRQSTRIIVYNSDEEYTATLRSDLLSIPGIQIVAEVDEHSLIEQAVRQFPAEIVLINVDPMPDVILPIAGQVAGAHPDLAVFVVSESTNGRHILMALRSGIREFLTKPVERELLAKALEKVMSQATCAVRVGPLISVLGTIGGAGASMLAINLATELNDIVRKRPVALVDLDFRYGQLGTMLDLHADYTIADLCDTPEQLDTSMIEKAMVKHNSGVHLLARPNQFTQADQITAAHCASVLSSLQQMYEFVVVDGPNRFDTGGMAVLDLADVNLFVMQLLVTSVRNVHRMIEGLREGGYNLDRFRLVCNRVGRDSAHLETEHVEATLKRKIDYQIPDDWKAVSSAINMGVPLIERAPKSRVRAAIRELAQAIISPEPASEKSKTPKRGLFGRILSNAS